MNELTEAISGCFTPVRVLVLFVLENDTVWLLSNVSLATCGVVEKTCPG